MEQESIDYIIHIRITYVMIIGHLKVENGLNNLTFENDKFAQSLIRCKNMK